MYRSSSLLYLYPFVTLYIRASLAFMISINSFLAAIQDVLLLISIRRGGKITKKPLFFMRGRSWSLSSVDLFYRLFSNSHGSNPGSAKAFFQLSCPTPGYSL